jgi:hypothetical protein
MLSESHELRIRVGASQDLSVTLSHCVSTLALERAGNDCRSTAGCAGVDDLVNELDQLIGETHSYLPTHPRMVPKWEQASGILAPGPVVDGQGVKPANLCRMCRNIRTLHNFEPTATEEEVQSAALQYVRKISGFTKPSQANAAAFERAVDEIAEASARLLGELVSSAPAKNREIEAAKRKERSAQRFAA